MGEALTEDESERPERDWFWLEVLLLPLVLIAGAGARYWLSTVLPFDDREVAVLAEAVRPEASLRVPMIMFVGLALFFFYVLLRRIAGIEAAFAALLLLQTSLSFQEQALRLHLSTLAAPLVMGALMAWRLKRPELRLSPALRRACIVLALLLAARGTWLAATLPERLDRIRSVTLADTRAFEDSLRACGAEDITPREQLDSCAIAWPDQMGLNQQVVGLQHAARLGEQAHRVANADAWPEKSGAQVILLDRAGACLIVVPAGPPADVAREVLRSHGHSR